LNFTELDAKNVFLNAQMAYNYNMSLDLDDGQMNLRPKIKNSDEDHKIESSKLNVSVVYDL
jgi:hypothetical protein